MNESSPLVHSQTPEIHIRPVTYNGQHESTPPQNIMSTLLVPTPLSHGACSRSSGSRKSTGPDIWALTSVFGEEQQEPGIISKIFPSKVLPEVKRFSYLCFFLVLSQVTAQCIQPVTIMFSRGMPKLEAKVIALSNSLISIMGSSVVVGMSTACDTVFSQITGKNLHLVGIQLQRTTIICFLGLLINFALQFNLDRIMIALGQDSEIAMLTGRYMKLFMPGMFFYALYILLRKFVQCQALVIPHIIIGGLGVAAHCLFQYLLVHKYQLGLDGSTLAQIIGYFVMLLMSLFYIYFSKMYEPTWNGITSACLHGWGQEILLALCGMVMCCLEWWTFGITIALAGMVSTDKLAAQTILFNIFCCFVLSMHSGVSIAAAIRVGNELGALHTSTAQTACRVAYVFTAGLSVITSIIYYCSRRGLVSLFTKVDSFTEELLEVFPFFIVFVGTAPFTVLGRGLARGFGIQGKAALIVFCHCLLSLTIGSSLLFLTDLGLRGIWIGIICGSCFAFITSFVYVNLLLNWPLLAILSRHKMRLKQRFSTFSSSKSPSPRKIQRMRASRRSSLLRVKHALKQTYKTTVSRLTSASIPEVVFQAQEVDRGLIVLRLLVVLIAITVFIIGASFAFLIPFRQETFSFKNASLYNSSFEL